MASKLSLGQPYTDKHKTAEKGLCGLYLQQLAVRLHHLHPMA